MNADRKANLQKLFATYQTEYESEAQYIPRFRHLLAQPIDPFSRLNPEAHITGSAIIVDRRIESIYQIWHAKVGRWLQPGGHVEDDDVNVYAGALRELLEETGFDPTEIIPFSSDIFDVDIHPIGSGSGAHEHFDVRFAFEFVGDLRDTPIPPARWYCER
jgi:NUDIX domain